MRAITATIRRSGYILIPLSVLLIKYYEGMGRVVDDWGQSYYTGVTLDKNMFGYLLFAFGLFFVTELVHVFRQDSSGRAAKRTDLVFCALCFVVSSAGSFLSAAPKSNILLASSCRFPPKASLRIATGLPPENSGRNACAAIKIKRHLWSFLIATVLIAAISNELFSVKSAVLEASGRDATLTGRTGIWQAVLSEPINPLFGTGYTAFWLGDRLQRIWALFPRTPIIQAHNGYIEVYLNLGLVGLALLGGVLWTALRNARRRLLAAEYTAGNLDDGLFQTFGIAYILAYLLYNSTEAAFEGLSFLYMIFLFLAFDLQHTSSDASTDCIEQGYGRRTAPT